MIPKGSLVKCIRCNGGDVRVGDEGYLIEDANNDGLASVWFDTMSNGCKRTGCWYGEMGHHLELVDDPVNEEGLYY